MVYFKRVVVENLNTGKSVTLSSRYGVYILKASKGDSIKFIIDLGGVGPDDAIKIDENWWPIYQEQLKGRTHIEITYTLKRVPCSFEIKVGRIKTVYRDGRVHHPMEVQDERTIEIKPAPKPIPILHLNIPSHWEPSCPKFPCIISFTGTVYDATEQHKYAYCNITATIKDLDTGELSTVQTTTDTNGNFRITFNVRRPGKKKIEVVAHTPDGRAEAEAIVNVIGPELRIAQISADKTTITEGESVKVTATIMNSGNTDGTCVAELFVDGLLVTDKKLTVPAKSSVKVSFKVEDLRKGLHMVCVRI